MFQPHRLVWIVFLGLVLFAVSVTSDSGAEPPELSVQPEKPEHVDLELPNIFSSTRGAWSPNPVFLSGDVPSSMEDGKHNARIRKRISETLDNGLPGADSGDPILDDVLQIIGQRGSILDGSSLDSSPDPPSSTSRGDRSRAAEALLKASRLLEKVESGDVARNELVDRMRVEAAKLLAQ